MIPLLTLALATVTVPPADIVVRARRTEAALDQCLAKGCPTPDDVRLSMAQAELQFQQGAYRDARTTLAQAINRNRAAAARYPRMVAALQEASATVNLHYGDREGYRRAMIGRSEILRTNLPANDPQVILLAIELGDYYAHKRDWRAAERQYETARDAYAGRGEDRLAALAGLRGAYMALTRDSLNVSAARLRAISAMPAARDPVVAQMIAVLTARIAAARGDSGAVDTLLATLRTDPAKPPVLLEQAPYVATASEAAQAAATRFDERNILAPYTAEAAPIQWVDIGFMVLADGSVSDVDILRSSRNPAWAAQHVKRITSRRYAPLALPPGQQGMYRVERYTLRARRIVPHGSLIKQAAGPLEVETLDLTASAVKPPA